ncbi:MAG: alanine racemase [Oscillospiraceae bacterium]|nr:alanine racemase [Oscillospiraceae bacterium]
MNLPEKHCWAKISLKALRDNFNFIKNSFNMPFYVVLKADGYGHGARYLAKIYEEMGAFGVAVSCYAEAMEIRSSGVKLPILILGYTSPGKATQLSKYQITQTVHSLEYAKQLQQQSLYPIDCHLKLDTGMGRIGFDLVADKEKAFEEMKQLLELPNLRFTGLYSHFPAADSFEEEAVLYTEKQIELFNEAYDYLTRYGFDFKIVHGQNSAGILRKLNGRFNAMRAGIILYGMCPSDSLAGGDLTPVMEIKTVVTHVKDIKKDQYVGYGLNFKAEMPMTVATVAIGYADGLPRFLKNKDYTMNINGVDYPLIAVCMDQCMLDVTFGNVKIGDEVVAMGGTGAQNFDRIAKMTGTINYEIPCGIQRRVPKVFMEDDKVVFVENNMA